ncbi:MAG: EAL domain-containing protein [Spirulina sp. SIO3F2]|nr:EAL domain-containing protein [Spirulina sp. SIO3F2]
MSLPLTTQGAAIDSDCSLEQAYFHQLLHLLPTPVVVARLGDGQLLCANDHFRQLLGLGTQSLIALQFEHLIEPTVWPILQQAVRQHHCLLNYELKLHSFNGQALWGILSLQLLLQADSTADPLFIGVVQETTCARRLEQALQHHFPSQAIAQHLPVLFYQFPAESGRHYWVSGEVEALTGEYRANHEPQALMALELLAWVHPDDRLKTQRLHQQALAEHSNYCVDYRIMTTHNEIKWVQDQGHVVYQDDNRPILQGIWLDVTAYKWAEQESRLLHQLMQAISNAPNFDAAMGLVLEQVCQIAGWDFGEVWVPDGDCTTLELAPIWHRRHELPQLEAFRQASLAFRFEWGVGLPGRVWQTRQSQWFPDASTEPLFVRAALAQTYGLKAGFGVPILADDDVVAVLVFFMRWEQLRDPQLLRLVATLASELGQSLQRKQQAQAAHEMEQALQESQRQLKSLIDALPGMFFRAENQPGWPLSYLSEGCADLTGYAVEEFLNTPHQFYDHLIHPSDRDRVQTAIRAALSQRTPYVVEYRIRTKTGIRKWVWEKGHGVYGDNQNEETQATQIEGFITDITERKATEEALAAAEDKYRSIFENALEGIFQTTPDGRYLDANPALARIYGYDSPADLMVNLTDIQHQLYVDEAQRQVFQTLMQEQGVVVGFEAQVYRRDRSIIWITESAHAVTDETGDVLYYEGLVMDITNQKQAEAELHQRAFYDPLTHLPNRALFARRLAQALQRSQTEVDYEFVVLFLDLDRFKVVNDSLGHLVGDQLLVAIARRLETCLRTPDLVARIGGDEFTILLDNISDLTIAQQVAQRIETALQEPFTLGEHEIFSSTSIGMVWSKPGEGEQSANSCTLYANPEDLLRDADTALYAAKARGKGCYQLFDPTMHQGALQQFNQETELHRALEANELTVQYQPIYQLQTSQLYGFEAQLYWQHVQQGCLATADFLTLADETHLSIPIYRWFLTQICQDLQAWSSFPESLKIHFRCFSSQVLQTNWIDDLSQTCQHTGVNPQCFRLEVMDGFWRQEQHCLNQQLQTLTEQQLQLCIHDFGLGMASFQALHQQPISALRLKENLVELLDTNTNQRDILRIMTVLAHHLKMETLATGVTTALQSDYLQQLGCQYAQGNWFSPPLSLAVAQALVLDSGI